jgi:hypothetical protein
MQQRVLESAKPGPADSSVRGLPAEPHSPLAGGCVDILGEGAHLLGQRMDLLGQVGVLLEQASDGR